VRFGQWVGLLLLIAAAYIVWETRQLLLLVFGAIVLANSLNLLANRLERSGMKRSLAVFYLSRSQVSFC